MAIVESGHALTSILDEVERAHPKDLYAYYCGASRDGCYSKAHNTFRITQRDRGWLEVLHCVIARQERKSWIYREGRRDVWTIESGLLPSRDDPVSRDHPAQLAAFARGYFDAEGGIPRSRSARFYIQLVQKNKMDLVNLRQYFETLAIHSGKIHNPSVRVDPDYWRFLVRSSSQQRFISDVGSWHPRKRELLEERRLRGRSGPGVANSSD